jgi:hypothetical protein
LKTLVAMMAAAVALGSEMWVHEPPAPPLVGFSFSPLISQNAGRSPTQDLKYLLDSTSPDLVRLPIYWELVEPTPQLRDFSSIDELMEVVTQHDLHSAVTTRVVLTVGARNFLYPELHAPDWAGPRMQPYLGQAQSGFAYRDYFDLSIARYRGSPLLYAWQVENEPLDYVTNELTGEDRISPSQLAWEVGEVHRLDPQHKVALTSYDGPNVAVDMLQIWVPQVLKPFTQVGHPETVMQTADALGLDLYVDGPIIPYRRLTSISLRSQWKEDAVGFWSDRAQGDGKDMWLAEIQAQPWGGSSTFKTSDLMATAVNYRQEDLQVALLWGVDTWLEDPAWLSAAGNAMDILRAP